MVLVNGDVQGSNFTRRNLQGWETVVLDSGEYWGRKVRQTNSGPRPG
jgi:hypothetical protein